MLIVKRTRGDETSNSTQTKLGFQKEKEINHVIITWLYNIFGPMGHLISIQIFVIFVPVPPKLSLLIMFGFFDFFTLNLAA